jgi:hypothetical protein
MVSAFHVSSTSPWVAKKRIARLCDSVAALPGRSGGTTRGSSNGDGASKRIRRAHRPSRRPRRSRRAIGTDALSDIVPPRVWPLQWSAARRVGRRARKTDPQPTTCARTNLAD